MKNKIKLIVSLLKLVRPFLTFMLLAIILGVLGHLTATFITIFIIMDIRLLPVWAAAVYSYTGTSLLRSFLLSYLKFCKNSTPLPEKSSTKRNFMVYCTRGSAGRLQRPVSQKK